MGVSDDVLETFQECSVQQRDCVDSIAFSEAHNAIFLLDQSRNTRVQYIGLEPGVEVKGAADIELISQRGGEEGIRSMAFNKTGSLLLLAGAHLSVVRVDKTLSRRESRTSLKGVMLVKGVPLRTEVIHAAWHPLSPQHIVALVKQHQSCALHVFGLPEHGELSVGMDEQVIPISLQAFPELRGSPEDWRSFAFGPVGSESYWERFTIYLLHASGLIFALCPVIPHGCKFSRDAVNELYNMLPMSREDGTFGDLDADTAYEVLQKFFPTFDPFSSRPAGLVESRRPQQYPSPALQLVHNFEGSTARRSTHAWHLSLLNPDGSMPIMAVSMWDSAADPSVEPQCRVEVGVVLHLIHPQFTPGKWSRESTDGVKSLAVLDFKQWRTSRPPSVLVDSLRLGTIYVVLSDHVFRADLPIVSKVDSCKSVGQWRIKEPTVRELRGPATARSDIIGACVTCKLEGGDASWLYVRRRQGEESFGVDLTEAGPYLVDNLLELQRTRTQVTHSLTQGPASMLLSANKYTRDLERKVQAGKTKLGLEREELTAQVVGPRRWLELRMADRIQEISTAILLDEENRVAKLRRELQEQGDLKGLKQRATELERELTGSSMKLQAVGQAISSLRTRMTPQERQAKQALEVAEKRLQRLSKMWERIRKSVMQPVEAKLDSDQSLAEQLSNLSLERQDDTPAGREEEKVLSEVKEGVSRIDRLLQNLEDRASAMRNVLEEEGQFEEEEPYPRAIQYGP